MKLQSDRFAGAMEQLAADPEAFSVGRCALLHRARCISALIAFCTVLCRYKAALFGHGIDFPRLMLC